MSLFAESIRRCVASASASMACFLAVASSNCCCILASSACTASSSFCAAASLAIATLSFPSATLSAAIFGLTSLEIAVYSTIELTQMHSPATLPLAFLASAYVISSASVKGKSSSIVSSLIASLLKLNMSSRNDERDMTIDDCVHDTSSCSRLTVSTAGRQSGS